MAYTLDKKLKELEFRRKQVQRHLSLLDDKIYTLRNNSDNERRTSRCYRIRYRTIPISYCTAVFTTNSATLIIRLLKTEPHRYWRVEEITKEIFICR